jgi:hypothetical protein
MLMRVPNYNNVTINGTLTADGFDGLKNGVLMFRVAGTLGGGGTIDMNYKGFGNASGPGAGGSAPYDDSNGNGDGGGAGYATGGEAGLSRTHAGGVGGLTYGDQPLQDLFLGSGGGQGGGAWWNTCPPPPNYCWEYEGGPSGGAGGGAISISAQTINFTGGITAVGQSKIPNALNNRWSGAGSGGSIRIEGNSITLGTLSATGGSPGASGAGGSGRIAVYYQTGYTASTANPSPYVTIAGQSPTPTPGPTAVPNNPGTINLVSWWTLNETSGTRLDSHGSNQLTDNNTVGYTAGLKGNAASFVTVNLEYLSIADNPSLSTGDIDFSLVANVYLNNNTNSFVIVNKSDDNHTVLDYRLTYNPGTGFRFRADATTYVDSGAVSANAWHTVIGWHDSVNNTINIQVDNGTVNTTAYSGGATDTSYPLTMGAYSYGAAYLDGRMDEVALYKRVLTAGERSWLYNSGAARTYTDLSQPTSPSAGWYANKYSYSTTIPHAVTSVNRVNFTDTFTYDENGNMTCRVESNVKYIQTYNAENRIASIQKLATGTCAAPGNLAAKWDFAYDGDGVRTLTVVYTPYDVNGQPQTATVTSLLLRRRAETSGGAMKKYYSLRRADCSHERRDDLQILPQRPSRLNFVGIKRYGYNSGAAALPALRSAADYAPVRDGDLHGLHVHGPARPPRHGTDGLQGALLLARARQVHSARYDDTGCGEPTELE